MEDVIVSHGAWLYAEQAWLDSLDIVDRRKYIDLNGKKVFVDGYCKVTNTVYEFLGDYWHGNPEVYDHTKYNTRCRKKFGDLYKQTFERLQSIEQLGYTVVYIWEKTWRENNL